MVWANSEPEPNLAGKTLTILARDLIHSGSTPGCTDAARNLATFKAAAEARLLYIEIEKSHAFRIVQRGQLWPRSIGLQDGGFASMAGASDQQSIDARDAAPLWQRLAVTLSFSETNQTLAYIGYSVPYPHRFRNVSLHCAPPGREGQPVAFLPAGEGTLSNAEIVPVYESGAAGWPSTTLRHCWKHCCAATYMCSSSRTTLRLPSFGGSSRCGKEDFATGGRLLHLCVLISNA